MWTWTLLAMALAGQGVCEPVRGVLLEWDGDARAGQFSLRAADFRVHVFLFDQDTAIQREGRSVSVSALVKGDTLQVSCREGEDGLRRHARAVWVAVPARPPQGSAGLPPGRPPEWGGEPFPRGSLTLSGVVTDVRPGRLQLRIRGRGERIILLRDDTRWLSDGRAVDLPALRVNTHVFIRAGRTLEGDLEAFQVVWGRILRVP